VAEQASRSWAGAGDVLPPTVLVLGGFLTSPPFYRPLRRRLLQRGAAAVIVADVWTTDWLVASVRGLGPVLERARRGLRIAVDAAAGGPSLGAPVLVVGHSAGGILARLLTSPEPFGGRTYALADAIGAIVSLGSPHHVGSSRTVGRRVGDAAARFADQVVPGAMFSPCTGYVTVASRMVVGRRDGTGRERVAHRLYHGLTDEPFPAEIPGDGVVPVQSALLEGARHVVLRGIAHGQAAGRPWYGTDEAMDAWWPEAIGAWRDALRARAAGDCTGTMSAGTGTGSRPYSST
jgi:hypothetical protein